MVGLATAAALTWKLPSCSEVKREYDCKKIQIQIKIQMYSFLAKSKQKETHCTLKPQHQAYEIISDISTSKITIIDNVSKKYLLSWKWSCHLVAMQRGDLPKFQLKICRGVMIKWSIHMFSTIPRTMVSKNQSLKMESTQSLKNKMTSAIFGMERATHPSLD